MKRRLVAFALEKCRESSADNPFDGFAVEDPPRFSFSGPKNALYPYDDADWAKYVAGIKIKPRLSFGEYIKTSGLVTGVVALVKNMIPWESRVWSSTAQGKILLSETSSESMAFKRDSGQLEIYRTPLTKSERNDKELNAKMLNEVKVRLFNIYK